MLYYHDVLIIKLLCMYYIYVIAAVTSISDIVITVINNTITLAATQPWLIIVNGDSASCKNIACMQNKLHHRKLFIATCAVSIYSLLKIFLQLANCNL